MKKLLSLIFFISSLQAYATWCTVTTVDWHINTEDGMIVGQTTYINCYDHDGGGVNSAEDQDTGGNTGHNTSGGGTSSGTPNSLPNQGAFLDCFDQVIAYQPKPEYPSGIRPFEGSTHEGCDLECFF